MKSVLLDARCLEVSTIFQLTACRPGHKTKEFCLCAVSLPRFIVVPQKVLDTELKKSFAHFNEGRIPVSTLGVKEQSDLQ